MQQIQNYFHGAFFVVVRLYRSFIMKLTAKLQQYTVIQEKCTNLKADLLQLKAIQFYQNAMSSIKLNTLTVSALHRVESE